MLGGLFTRLGIGREAARRRHAAYWAALDEWVASKIREDLAEQMTMECARCGAKYKDKAPEVWWITETDCGCRSASAAKRSTKAD